MIRRPRLSHKFAAKQFIEQWELTIQTTIPFLKESAVGARSHTAGGFTVSVVKLINHIQPLHNLAERRETP
jgi:hypothetical protein